MEPTHPGPRKAYVASGKKALEGEPGRAQKPWGILGLSDIMVFSTN